MIKKFDDWKEEEKIIINAFLCYRSLDYAKWKGYLNKYNNLKKRFDWWVEPQLGHHLGLAFESILNTNDMEDAEKIANEIYKDFDDDILIVLSKGTVRNYEPVGQNNDEAFVGCGRYFDELVRKREKGIYIYEN